MHCDMTPGRLRGGTQVASGLNDTVTVEAAAQSLAQGGLS